MAPSSEAGEGSERVFEQWCIEQGTAPTGAEVFRRQELAYFAGIKRTYFFAM